MPVAVDIELRNQQVAAAAVELIAEGGMDAVTFRNLARKLECSTTVISHYFRTRKEILLATYLYMANRRRNERLQSFRNKNLDLLGLLCEILPINGRKRRDWKVWMCFWAIGLVDEKMSELQRERHSATRQEIRDALLATGYGEGDVDDLSAEIMTAIYGIAIQSMFDPDAWGLDRQRAAMAQVLAGGRGKRQDG